jgi:polysaccharide export outer membrane protein
LAPKNCSAYAIIQQPTPLPISGYLQMQTTPRDCVARSIVEDIVLSKAWLSLVCSLLLVGAVGGCSNPKYPQLPEATYQMRYGYKYKVGPGDSVQIYVWRYPEVSTTVPVRPDGYISAPLLEDVPAAGKTPTELARDLEEALSVFLRDPLVTVIVQGFVGIYPEQIRVLGEATQPLSLPYRDGMTLLDLMIAVGGITEFADGNRSVLIRFEDGEQTQHTVRLRDLIEDADLSANVDMQPGDILLIPESWF